MASLIMIGSLILLVSQIKLASPSISCSDLMPDNYDAMKAPSNDSVIVSFQHSVMNIARVNIQDQTFSLKLRIMLEWIDSRLLAPPKLISFYIDQSLESKYHECFWTPTFTIANLADEEMIDQTRYLILKDVQGLMRYVRRFKFPVTCPMDFTWYPRDVQTCAVKFFSWKADHVTLIWSKTNMFKDTKRSESAYDVTITRSGGCIDNDRQLSCLQLVIKFERRLGMFLMTTYFSSSLIVIISFISFWIDPLSAPGRVTLTITSLLALMTQFISVRDPLSDVNHVTAIDVWFMGCILQVALVMFEFCFTHFLARQVTRVKIYEPSVETGSASESKSKSAVRLGFKRIKRKLITTNYDVLSRIIFPTIFIIYTIIYWVTLTSYSSE